MALPAMLALLAKLALYLLVRWNWSNDARVKAYLGFLLALSVQNIGEIGHFYALAYGFPMDPWLTLYYMASVLAAASIFQLGILMTLSNAQVVRVLSVAAWTLGITLVCLLSYSKLLIVGFENLGHTATRIPGQWFDILQGYLLFTLIGAAGFFAYGCVRPRNQDERERARNMLVLVAFLPIVIVVTVVLVALQYDYRSFNAALILPIAITIFVGITAYAIHRHRVFDLRFYIPGSGTRRNKLRLYEDINGLVKFLRTHPQPIQELVNRLSQTLGAGVRLVSNRRSYNARSEGCGVDKPLVHDLRHIHEMVVLDEVKRRDPELFKQMRALKCGIILPFVIDDRSARGWLLIDEGVCDRLYTAFDYELLGQLFDHIRRMFVAGVFWQPYKLQDEVREVERELLLYVLARANGNQAKAARWLDIPPSTMHFKLERYGIRDEIDTLGLRISNEMEALTAD